MVHDELEDFATPVMVRRETFVYDNEQYNNEQSESDEDEMDYNYDDEYFYWEVDQTTLQQIRQLRTIF